MDEWIVLILLSFAMFVGCYVSGAIPLFLGLSEDKLQLVSVMGAGILVGTALTIIIPEGVNALITAQTRELQRIAEAVEALKPDKPTSVKLSEHHSHHGHDHSPGSIESVHPIIGPALVLGFVFMLIIDQAFSKGERTKLTATLGLVVHAAADGVALGAAATTSHREVEMIVFVAIMLHKAPAAFGLVSFLLHAGFDRQRIRKHLFIFALAAPLLAILTYFGISQQGKETLSTFHATGIAMLFSAGTFLYVATVHVLPELTSRSGNHCGKNALVDAANGGHNGLKFRELFVMVFGALLPLVISVNHKH